MSNLLFLGLTISLGALLVVEIGKSIWVLSQFYSLWGTKQQLLSLLRKREKQGALLNRLYTSADIYQTKKIRIKQLLDNISTLGWQFLSFWEFSDKEQVLIFRYHTGLPKILLDVINNKFHGRVDIGSVAGGRAASTKQPVVVNDWSEDPQLESLRFLSTHGNFHSFAAFPVVGSEQVYGTVHIYCTKFGMFKLNEVQFFTTVVNSLAAILEHDELRLEGGDKNGNDIGESQKDN